MGEEVKVPSPVKFPDERFGIERRFAMQPVGHQRDSQSAVSNKEVVNFLGPRPIVVGSPVAMLKNDEWSIAGNRSPGSPQDLQLRSFYVDLYKAEM
jgi:hypothetical protein